MAARAKKKKKRVSRGPKRRLGRANVGGGRPAGAEMRDRGCGRGRTQTRTRTRTRTSATLYPSMHGTDDDRQVGSREGGAGGRLTAQRTGLLGGAGRPLRPWASAACRPMVRCGVSTAPPGAFVQSTGRYNRACYRCYQARHARSLAESTEAFGLSCTRNPMRGKAKRRAGGSRAHPPPMARGPSRRMAATVCAQQAARAKTVGYSSCCALGRASASRELGGRPHPARCALWHPPRRRATRGKVTESGRLWSCGARHKNSAAVRRPSCPGCSSGTKRPGAAQRQTANSSRAGAARVPDRSRGRCRRPGRAMIPSRRPPPPCCADNCAVSPSPIHHTSRRPGREHACALQAAILRPRARRPPPEPSPTVREIMVMVLLCISVPAARPAG